MEKIRVAVIGAGRIGRIHAKNLRSQIPGAQLLAIADPMVEAARKLAEELELPRYEADYRRIMDDREIEAVAICSSTDTHAQIMMEAAAAGKHIFCEKPIAFDIQTIDRALAAVERAGVKLMVGFNRRFDPGFKKAKELIRAGRIGRPHLLRITSRDPQPPPPEYVKGSGGLFLDMTIHDFDMARYLLEEEVMELMAAGNCLVDPAIGELGDIDTAVVVLKFQSGALGIIDNSRRAVYGYDQRIEVFGSEGVVMVGNRTPAEVTVADAQAVAGEKPLWFFLERYREAYLAEMEHFVACILEDETPSVSGFDGKISVQMACAALESLHKGIFIAVK